jgi:hypothetical protein
MLMTKRAAALAATILAVVELTAQPISAAETTESQLFSNISTTTAAFTLKGGKYQACVVATFGGGSVKLRTLGPDGTTYLSVSSATDFAASGCATIDLAPGQFEFVIATDTTRRYSRRSTRCSASASGLAPRSVTPF